MKKQSGDKRQQNLTKGIDPDVLIYEMFQKTDVQFVGSQIYKPYHGWESATEEEMLSVFAVIRNKGSQMLEYIVEGDEQIISCLKELVDSTNFFALNFDDAVEFLQNNYLTYEIILEEEAAEV
jgi:hypothetical protein